jgi:hypothetical protein
VTYDPQVPVGEEGDRSNLRAPTGQVGLRNFDEGVVVTLGAEIEEVDLGKGPLTNYFIKTGLLPVEPPPGLPGVPITFSHPEDIWERYRIPVIVVRRDGIDPALQRWHPGMVAYNAPAEGAAPVSVIFGAGTTTEETREGFDRYERLEMGVPFDITYTISILARYRGKGPLPPTGSPVGFDGSKGSPRNQVNQILDYVLRKFPPYGQVFVTDSVGDVRGYSSFMDAISHLDEVPEITERVLGFAVTVRVEAELDLDRPLIVPVVTAPLTIRSHVR